MAFILRLTQLHLTALTNSIKLIVFPISHRFNILTEYSPSLEVIPTMVSLAHPTETLALSQL